MRKDSHFKPNTKSKFRTEELGSHLIYECELELNWSHEVELESEPEFTELEFKETQYSHTTNDLRLYRITTKWARKEILAVRV